MKKLRKKRESYKNYLKLSEIIKDNINDITIFDVFQESLNYFCKYFDIVNVKIVFVPYTVKVITDNTVWWNKHYHELLCKYYGLKLVKYNYVQDGVDICVNYTYAADWDDGVPALDFDDMPVQVFLRKGPRIFKKDLRDIE